MNSVSELCVPCDQSFGKDEPRLRVAVSESMRARLQAELAKLKPGTTICPGKLSRMIGRTLRETRPILEALARADEIQFYQRGARVAPDGLRGPFRVGHR